ncbi:MAG: hypothetical protein IJ071_07780 [Ruminococcus sp.]|nr:hypothetical protein [Ruminococcus sp.]
MMSLKKIAAGLSALALAAGSYGCTPSIGAGSQNALTADGYEIKSGIFIYYTMQAYDDAISVISEQNGGTSPTLKDVKNAYIDEIESSDWIQDKAADYCKSFAAVKKEYDNIGGQLSAADKEDAAEMAQYYYSGDERNSLNGISLDSMKEIAENTFREEQIFQHYYGFDGEKGCSEEELKDYFDENFARVEYVSMSLTDSEGNALTEDEARKVRKLAEDYAAQVNKKSKGQDKMFEMDTIKQQYSDYLAAQTTTSAEDALLIETTTTAAADDAETETTETTTTNPHENEMLLQRNTTTTASAEGSTETTETEAADTNEDLTKFKDFVFDELAMDTATVYDYSDDTIYVVIRTDLRERLTEDDLWNETYITNLQQLRYYDDFVAYMEGIADGMTVERNKSAFRRYSPFKLVLETNDQ